jgi:hypothetical protein
MFGSPLNVLLKVNKVLPSDSKQLTKFVLVYPVGARITRTHTPEVVVPLIFLNDYILMPDEFGTNVQVIQELEVQSMRHEWYLYLIYVQAARKFAR